MYHSSVSIQQRFGRSLWCCLLACALFLTLTSPGLSAETAKQEKNTIISIQASQTADGVQLQLTGTTEPNYTVYELFKPPRIVIDVADSEVKGDITPQLPAGTDISLATETITDSNPPLTRFTITLPESRQFSVADKGKTISLNIAKGQKKTAASPPAKTSITINDIKVATKPGETIVMLVANGKIPSYRYDVIENKGKGPARLYIDVNDVNGDTLTKKKHVGTALADIKVAKRATGLRFVLESASDSLFPFQVAPLANGLEIRIHETAAKAKGKDTVASLIEEKKLIESQLPKVDASKERAEAIDADTVAASMKDAFNFSGYNKERITVDFYKIDLHNVFRLIREVSGMNIIVDEAVSGSLTLALDDVPWDFALDIILNLKDLQKEERFNTIIIHPKSKAFNWPQQAADNLSFETDEAVTEQEAILIQQQMSIPPTVVAAKQSIAKAQSFEKKEEYELAIAHYKEAFKKWPDNAKLASKIASLYLVQLRQNAKALYYAKKALKVDRHLASAALTAAIASANMQDMKTAQRYFDRAIQGKKPLKEALLSYAAFSEQQKRYSAALKLLGRHDKMYGEDLNSIVSRARILDKMNKHADATAEYKKLLYSGFRIAPDLKKYIQGRIALSQSL
jgi:type IV pilus assembly protein PilQ